MTKDYINSNFKWTHVLFIYPACFGTEQIQLNYVTAFVMGIRGNKMILRNRNKVISALTKIYPEV